MASQVRGGSRAGKRNYGNKSKFFAEIKELAKFAGVRRKDLPVVLGPNLRRAWRIDPSLDNPALRETVEHELEALLDNEVKDEPKKYAVLRVGFNLCSQDFRTDLTAEDTLGERLKCCSSDTRRDEWEPSGREVPGYLKLVDLKPDAAANNIDAAIEENLAPAIRHRLDQLTEPAHQEPSPEAPPLRPDPSPQDLAPQESPASVLDVARARWRQPSYLIGGTAVLAVLALGTLGLVYGMHPSASDQSNTPVLVQDVSVSELVPIPAASYVFPGIFRPSNSDLKALDQAAIDPSAFDAWFASRGAVMADSIMITMTLRGNAPGETVVPQIQVFGKCSAPLDGTLFSSSNSGQPGAAEIGFNLDDNDPIAQNAVGGNLQGSYFQDHTITLDQGEPQAVSIVAETSRHYCTFSIKLTVQPATGPSIVETVTNNGAPFRITALLPPGTDGKPYAGYQALYVGGVTTHSGGWQPENPATSLG